MINHHGTWLPTIHFGLPVFAIIAVAFLVLAVACAFAEEGGMAALFVVCLLVVGVGTAVGYWPWHADYHKLQPVTGAVQAIDTRYLAASQYVVVTYQGGQIVRCDDSRCATVKPGDQLRLLCTKQHDLGSPQAVDGWACRWGEQ